MISLIALLQLVSTLRLLNAMRLAARETYVTCLKVLMNQNLLPRLRFHQEQQQQRQFPLQVQLVRPIYSQRHFRLKTVNFWFLKLSELFWSWSWVTSVLFSVIPAGKLWNEDEIWKPNDEILNSAKFESWAVLWEKLPLVCLYDSDMFSFPLLLVEEGLLLI